MNNIIDLREARQAPLKKLFDAHHQALAELVAAFAVHSVDGEHLDRFLRAQDDFVDAYLALHEYEQRGRP